MIPTVVAPHTPDAPLNPLPALREGRQSVALAGWGSSGLISNQADMILTMNKLSFQVLIFSNALLLL